MAFTRLHVRTCIARINTPDTRTCCDTYTQV